MVDTRLLKCKFIKLTNGMALLAFAAPLNEGRVQDWYLDRPLQTMSDIGPDGHSELLLFPFIPTTISPDKHTVLEHEKILFVVSVIDMVAEHVKRFAAEYYDKDQTIAVTDVTKRKHGSSNDDVKSLLDSLENSNNGSGNDEGGGPDSA